MLVYCSASARQLYDILLSHADKGYVDWDTCLNLAVTLAHEYDPEDVDELRALGWIKPREGGWDLPLTTLPASPFASR